MDYNITLIPGDGIGPEVTEATRRCVEATGIHVVWDEQIAGTTSLEQGGELIPDVTLASIKKNKIALKGPITTPVGKGFRSVNVALRQMLDLYANVRLCKSIKNVPRSRPGIDIVTVRENTEGLYAGIEFERGKSETKELYKFVKEKLGCEIADDSGVSLKPISERASRRIVKFAIDYAKDFERKKVTIGHKANILKFSDGLFLAVGKDEAAKPEHSYVTVDDYIIDNLCMKLVSTPEIFDVLVLPNLYGDIVSDLCAGLIGGLGVAAGANFGDEIAIFEPVHGSAPKHAGKNTVNPTACILSAVMMLRYLERNLEAERLENAVRTVIEKGESVTYDLTENREGGVSTSEMADAIIKEMS